jgi:hypothetical protein
MLWGKQRGNATELLPIFLDTDLSDRRPVW